MDKLTLYREALQGAGLRLTEQRLLICETLAATDSHPTPYQVYEAVARQHPEVARATVYNTLNTLQQLGAIVELSFGSDHTHYDTDPTPHVNLICLRCHRIADLHIAEELVELQKRVGAGAGFQMLAARAELLGICAACQAAAGAPLRSHDTTPHDKTPTVRES
jgi:Fur family transcriptional regulator, peroxide stress response regulator